MSEPIDELGVAVGIEMNDQEMEKSISYFMQLEKAASDAAASASIRQLWRHGDRFF